METKMNFSEKLREKFTSLNMRAQGRQFREKLSSIRAKVTGGRVSRLARKIPCFGKVFPKCEGGDKEDTLSFSKANNKEETTMQKRNNGESNESIEIHDDILQTPKTGALEKKRVRFAGVDGQACPSFSTECKDYEENESCNSRRKVLLSGTRANVGDRAPKVEVCASSDNRNQFDERSYEMPSSERDQSTTPFSVRQSNKCEILPSVSPDKLGIVPSPSPPIPEGESQELRRPSSIGVVNETKPRLKRAEKRIAFLKDYFSQNLPSLQNQSKCNGVYGSESSMTEFQSTVMDVEEVVSPLPGAYKASCSSSDSVKAKNELVISTERTRFDDIHSEANSRNLSTSSNEYNGSGEEITARKCVGIMFRTFDILKDYLGSSSPGKLSSDWFHLIEVPDEEE